MQGHVHLHVCGEGVGALVQQVADDGLVLVLAGPDQGGPAPVVLDVDVVPGQTVGPQEDVAALQVAVLCRQMESRHPVVALQLKPGPGGDKIAQNVGETLQDNTVSRDQTKCPVCVVMKSEIFQL